MAQSDAWREYLHRLAEGYREQATEAYELAELSITAQGEAAYVEWPTP